jgi:hypothetical protein
MKLAISQDKALAQAAGQAAVDDVMNFILSTHTDLGTGTVASGRAEDSADDWSASAAAAAASLAPEMFDTELVLSRSGQRTHTVVARAPGLVSSLAPYLKFNTDGSVVARPSGVASIATHDAAVGAAARGRKRARSTHNDEAGAHMVQDVDVSAGHSAAAQSATLQSGTVSAAPTAPPAVITKASRRAARADAPATAGKGWFDMVAPEMTEELKQDLQVLRSRRHLDPRRFYKGREETKLGKYFAVGTVVEGSLEGSRGRLTKAQRRGGMLAEVQADPRLKNYAKRLYGEVRDKAASTSKSAHFKRSQAKKASWKRK